MFRLLELCMRYDGEVSNGVNYGELFSSSIVFNSDYGLVSISG